MLLRSFQFGCPATAFSRAQLGSTLLSLKWAACVFQSASKFGDGQKKAKTRERKAQLELNSRVPFRLPCFSVRMELRRESGRLHTKIGAPALSRSLDETTGGNTRLPQIFAPMGDAKGPARVVVFRREGSAEDVRRGGEGQASSRNLEGVAVRSRGEGTSRRGRGVAKEKTAKLFVRDRKQSAAYTRARERIFGDDRSREDSPVSRQSQVSECSSSRSTSPVTGPGERQSHLPRPNVAIVRNREADLRDPDFTRGATRFAPGVDETEVYHDPLRGGRKGGRRKGRGNTAEAGGGRQDAGRGKDRERPQVTAEKGAYGVPKPNGTIPVATLIAPPVAHAVHSPVQPPVRPLTRPLVRPQDLLPSMGGINLDGDGGAPAHNDRVSEWLGGMAVDHRQRLGLQRLGLGVTNHPPVINPNFLNPNPRALHIPQAAPMNGQKPPGQKQKLLVPRTAR